MIYLTKGQILLNNPGLVVHSPTGYYEDGDSILCAAIFLPEEPICRFEAKYIAYGDLVYSITDEKKLMEEVENINPETLFGKTSENISVDEMMDKIKKTEKINEEDLKEDKINEEDEDMEEIEDNVEETEENFEEEVVSDPEISTPVEPEAPTETEPELIPVIETAPEVIIEPEVTPTESTPPSDILGFLKKKRRRKIS